MSRIFLAAPYTQWMDWTRGTVIPERKEFLNSIRQAFLNRGHAVFNAHQNEDWGEGWLAPEVCTPADFLAVQRADVLCVVLGDPPSPGVMTELGWASALGRPLVLLTGTTQLPALVTGLGEVTHTVVRPCPRELTADILDDLVAEVEAAAAAPARRPADGPVAGYPKTSLPYGYEAGELTAPRVA
ncbi:nucleoside 2-deoxyribosyltransferase [Streptomyces sp. NBC_01433]|uniref:hypothetical protein n=1 Tax=Streptomyces sp. NBC_01433 TaxID=2903864 RepID=UPI002254D804|nr:hypothetical protein [Streptomyces sp. NBC_01433]MCX4680629.1 nucleoside 2-deoxyribosyltransferase [Streptomyces sp. NBC_01433]